MTSKQSDVVMLLLGQTGVGKSTFINSAANDEVVDVGGGILSCTKDIRDISITIPADNPRRRVHLIDTPGFNDTWDGDVKIFEKIRKWLVEFHNANPSFEFAGILYLYDISQARNTARGDFSVTFKNFELPPLVENLHFVSTHWNSIKSPAACEREQELQKNYWKHMLERGAEVSRFGDSPESASAIISQALRKPPHDFRTVLREFEAIQQKVSASGTPRRRDIIGGFFARLFRTPGGISTKSKESKGTCN